jgi:hypothetical protein
MRLVESEGVVKVFAAEARDGEGAHGRKKAERRISPFRLKRVFRGEGF